MKAIVLAGGYAKRLWPLTKDIPKPLLKIGEKEIITYILEKLNRESRIDEIFISTNEKFEPAFGSFLSSCTYKTPIRLIIEPSHEENAKLGAVGGLRYLIEHISLADDVLIIAGDNLFEFSIESFLNFYEENGSSIALRKIDDQALLHQYGVCEVDNDLIISFQEKPEHPLGNTVSTACYALAFSDVEMVNTYLDEGNSPDAIGFFISWLIRRTDIYGFIFTEDWYDIGSLEGLEAARKKYAQK